MDQELKEVLQAINERFDKMDERFDRMDNRIDKMEERMEEHFDRLENDVTSVKHTLENDILLTLQNTISVCQDTNRKLDAYLEKND